MKTRTDDGSLFIVGVPLSLKLLRKPIPTAMAKKPLDGLSSLIDANLPEQFRITTPDRKRAGFGASLPYSHSPNNKKKKGKEKEEPFTRDSERSSTIFRFSQFVASRDKKLYINKSLEKERPADAQSMRVRELDHVLRISVPYISHFIYLLIFPWSFRFFVYLSLMWERVRREYPSDPWDL